MLQSLSGLLYIVQHLPCKEPKWLFNNISLLALQEQWLMTKTIPVGRKEKSMIIPQEYWSAPGISQHSSVMITSNSLYSNKLFLYMKQSSVACFVLCLASARKSSSGKINKRKMAFSGVLTLYVSEREREHGRRGLHFEYLAAVTTWVKATVRALQTRQPSYVPLCSGKATPI